MDQKVYMRHMRKNSGRHHTREALGSDGSLNDATIEETRSGNILDLVDYGRGVFPVRYLGVPLAPLKVFVAQYAPLLETVNDFLRTWNTKTISYAGKLELIRSVIQGVQSFWLQVFPVPQTILDRIVSICRIFLWGGKFAKVAWDDICLPKEEGVLAFIMLRCGITPSLLEPFGTFT
ncbi:unnamed protein product [Cuscuta europaea]|uniref:Uncharacterized protein n=1 Tax=Cuscuta europaea TaxID=41803 RepID=A0A9P0ZUP8_CUSEU|nr:unnamed protein product [Cuscuta europaea]